MPRKINRAPGSFMNYLLMALALALAACDLSNETVPPAVDGGATGDCGCYTGNGDTASTLTHVTGTDGCLAFDFSVDSGVAVYGSSVYFLPKVTNTCAEPWTFTGGCYPLKAAVLTRGVPFDRTRPWGLNNSILYLELPAGDCGAVEEYAFKQGETCEYKDQPKFIYWDPKIGDSGGYEDPVPAGFYDVYLLSYGKPDGPFSKALLVEVREK